MRQRFVQSFSTSGTEHEAIDAERLGKPYVAFIYDGQYIDWNTLSPTPPVPPEPVYSAMYLTFEVVSGGTIIWKSTDEGVNRPIQYSLNGGEWTTIPGDTAGTTINVVAGDIVSFKGNNNGYGEPDVGGVRRARFTDSTCVFKLYGNILSLCYNDDFEAYTAAKNTGGYNFKGMFEKTNVIDASNLVLPKTLYADDLCYMFVVCNKLEKAPTIEANATSNRCMRAMFSGCTKLNYIKCLATTITGANATTDWTAGVANTGTFVKHPNANWTTGVNGIPAGWTVEDADI